MFTDAQQSKMPSWVIGKKFYSLAIAYLFFETFHHWSKNFPQKTPDFLECLSQAPIFEVYNYEIHFKLVEIDRHLIESHRKFVETESIFLNIHCELVEIHRELVEINRKIFGNSS